MENRDYFWLFINKDHNEINANLYGKKILAQQYFSRVKNICRNNKLLEENSTLRSYTELSSQKENRLHMVLQKMRFVHTANKMTQ